MSPPDIRTTLPTLEQIEDRLTCSISSLENIIGIPSIISDEAEGELTTAIKAIREAQPLLSWVTEQVKLVPAPLTIEQAVSAPRIPSALLAGTKLPPREGDAFVDSMLTVAPSLPGSFPLRRAMLQPQTEMAALSDDGTLLIGMYDKHADGTERLNIESVPGVRAKLKPISYSLEKKIFSPSVESAALILTHHDTAPLELLPKRANMTLKSEEGPWLIAHMLMVDGAEVCAAIPPCVVNAMPYHRHWPVAALELLVDAMYQEKRIVFGALSGKFSAGAAPLFPGNKLISLKEQMDTLAGMTAPPIALTTEQAAQLRRLQEIAEAKTPSIGLTSRQAEQLRKLQAQQYQQQPSQPPYEDVESQILKQFGGTDLLKTKYSGRFVEYDKVNRDLRSGPVTSKELLRQRLEQEAADAARRMQMEKADQLREQAFLATVSAKWADEMADPPEMTAVVHVPKTEPAVEPATMVVQKRVLATTKRRQEEDDAARVVFGYWQQVMGKQRSIFDQTRKTRILARLKENKGDVSELCYAIDGAEKDPFIMGREERSGGRKYNDIPTIFRDRAQVERFAEAMKGYQRDEEHPVIAAMRGVQP